jgi:hypothetical protein
MKKYTQNQIPIFVFNRLKKHEILKQATLKYLYY